MVFAIEVSGMSHGRSCLSGGINRSNQKEGKTWQGIMYWAGNYIKCLRRNQSGSNQVVLNNFRWCHDFEVIWSDRIGAVGQSGDQLRLDRWRCVTVASYLAPNTGWRSHG
jgi:hypothetical protein